MKELTFDKLKISTRLVAEEAVRRGFAVKYIPGGRSTTGVLILSNETGDYVVKSTIGANTRGYGIFVANNKYLMGQLLDHFGIPTPETIMASNLNEALLARDSIGGDVIVKPVDTNHGVGVTTDISNDADLEKAVKYAQGKSGKKNFLVQQKCVGVDYRLLVVGDKMVAASFREPASVIGDSVHNISELIEAENRNPLRGSGHSSALSFIRINDAESHLSKKKLTLEYVPLAGEKIVVSDVANLSRGGLAVDVTDEVHGDVAKFAIRAAKVAGLSVCGVDVMATDISLNPKMSGAKIIELNECPGIRMHHFPSVGKSRDVAKEIFDQIIARGPING